MIEGIAIFLGGVLLGAWVMYRRGSAPSQARIQQMPLRMRDARVCASLVVDAALSGDEYEDNDVDGPALHRARMALCDGLGDAVPAGGCVAAAQRLLWTAITTAHDDDEDLTTRLTSRRLARRALLALEDA